MVTEIKRPIGVLILAFVFYGQIAVCFAVLWIYLTGQLEDYQPGAYEYVFLSIYPFFAFWAARGIMRRKAIVRNIVFAVFWASLPIGFALAADKEVFVIQSLGSLVFLVFATLYFFKSEKAVVYFSGAPNK